MNNTLKILIISRAFRAGDGITISNLFSKFEKESLYGLFQLYDPNLLDIFNDYYIIKDEYKPKRVLRVQISGNYNRKINKKNEKKYWNNYQFFKNKICLYIKRIGLRLLKYLDKYETRYSIDYTNQLEEWIKKINPDIIYTSLGDLPMANFIEKTHEKFPKLKIAVHCFDDWIYPSYPVLNRFKHIKECEHILMNILSYATYRFTSSELMALDFKKKYGYSFSCFPNPIEVKNFHDRVYINKKINNDILFLGKIGRHNSNAILDMIKAIELFNKNNDSKLIFKIYTDVDIHQLELLLGRIPNNIIIKKSIPNNEIPQIIHNASILFLPISINKDVEHFTKYSMSTKMGEYLASGRPVLFYGPSKIAMSQFLCQHDCAVVVNNKDEKDLSEGIRKCLSFDDDIIRKIQRGIDISIKYFNKESISKRFLNEFMDKF